jgi:hypothetical protein
MRAESTESLVAAWCARDRDAAFLPGDRAAIEATTAPRELIVAHVLANAPHADLFHACAVLGRLLAEHGGSPTLAAGVIDTLAELLPDLPTATARAARSAVAEGFAAARTEATRAEAAARWDFPGCAVPLEDAAVAIAAGFPDDDEDALAAWAARVANGVARAGFRRAILAGGERACAALFDALELAGVKVRTTSPPAPLGRR